MGEVRPSYTSYQNVHRDFFMFARKNWIVAAVLTLTLGGCGLHDYEARMGYEQDRLAYVAVENKLLGGPIVFIPRTVVKHPETTQKSDDKKKKKHSDEPLPTPILFLRLPKGIKTVGKEIAPESLLFAFAEKADESEPSSDVQAVYIAQTTEDKDFEKRVKDELTKTPEISAPEFKRGAERTVKAFGGYSLVYHTFVAKKNDVKFTIYLNSDRGIKTAIVLRQAKTDVSGSQAKDDDPVSYCLQSLAVGTRMAVALQSYHGP
jgi:hypothetical protein